jgi:adenosylhomocysteine nucleosidase
MIFVILAPRPSSLSDLAGGDHGANEMRIFFQLASDNSAAVVQRFLTVWTPPR